jgi:Spy/CpxP family protein refolding chaperone
MKSKLRWLCLVLVMLGADMVLADSPTNDPVHALLFPPEVLIQHRQEIGLTDAQVKRIQALAKEAGPQAQERQTRVNAAMGRLVQLLSAEKVDEAAALKRLEEVLSAEKDVKRLHLRLMIQIRNELSPQQRKVAATMTRGAQRTEGLEQRLQAKLARIEKEVQRRANAGQPPFDVVGLMQKFPELMEGGQVKEAESLLDRVMAMLGIDHADGVPNAKKPPGPPANIAVKMQQVQQRAQKLRQSGADVSKIRALMDKVGPLLQQGKVEAAEKLVDEALKLIQEGASAVKETPKSPEEVRTEVNGLQKEDVAWRHIEWKTCLLDGLKASREQSKPIMLWVFIDRPIDDERC